MRYNIIRYLKLIKLMWYTLFIVKEIPPLVNLHMQKGLYFLLYIVTVSSFSSHSSNILCQIFDCVDHSKLWKILTEMGIPDHFICLLRNLYTGQEATVRIGHGTTEWFQIGNGICQGCILSPCLFNLYAEYIMQNASWVKHKLESRLPGEISIILHTQIPL